MSSRLIDNERVARVTQQPRLAAHISATEWDSSDSADALYSVEIDIDDVMGGRE